MENLAKAVIAVMKEVKGVEKNLNVGTGNYSYKGVSDQEVKQIIGQAMAKNGLCILPLEVDPTIHIERWEEEQTYNNKTTIKQKKSILTEVKTKYLLLHESGESQVIAGYGHGEDTMDKSAGKSTTYALKYTLLYTFLTPTGNIDDADKEHSEEKPTPVKTAQKKTPEQPIKKVDAKPEDPKRPPALTEELFQKALKLTEKSRVEKALEHYRMSNDMREQLTVHLNSLDAPSKS